jgi:hypothetical protein
MVRLSSRWYVYTSSSSIFARRHENDCHMAGMLAIKVELHPSPRVIASQFLLVSETVGLATFDNMWNYIYTNVLDEEAAEKCGSFIRAEVASGEFKGTEIFTTEPVSAILNMQGVSSILFLVNQQRTRKRKLANKCSCTSWWWVDT